MHIMDPFVLYYEPLFAIDPGVISGICTRFGLDVIRVDQSQTNKSLGFLASYPGFANRPEAKRIPPPHDRILVFGDISSDLLDDVLEALKSAGAPPSLKAVLTSVNLSWSFDRLACELSNEHRAMGGT